MADHYIGLMSGTSVDGIDAVVVDLEADTPRLLSASTRPWPEALRWQILETIEDPGNVTLAGLGTLDAAIAEAFADAALAAVDEAGLDAASIRAIGSHGQTLFHAPGGPHGFSMQAGDPGRIAERTGITTVADFRRRDIAAGGQGAPLVPAFHQALFSHPRKTRAVVNIGGMANVTLLPAGNGQAGGYDTGPGNVLLDAWYRRHHADEFDRGGAWARSGTLVQRLLEQLLDHPYFRLAPPKSTGRETFCLEWLEGILKRMPPAKPADIQHTLTEFSARTIAEAVAAAGEIDEVLVCGGGVHNDFLVQRVAALLPQSRVESTETHGLHPDWVEAVAFAWLARRTLRGEAGNLPAVTGARHAVVLGGVYPGRRSMGT
ncbi:MAG TPA: anhydro-N-acetylmuramic acid kinase [Gammaproteobacteria bacterium]|nr:anhydro-N-acetylmuramic acid kinase [Gammaproteobacteria bacterium]